MLPLGAFALVRKWLATTAFVVALAVSSAAFAEYSDAGFSSFCSHRFGHGDVGYDSFLDSIGWALAVGDFNGAGLDDLTIGIPFSGCEDFTPERCGGAKVNCEQEGSRLANPLPTSLIGQFVPGSAGSAENGDSLGFALAFCDLNGDVYDGPAVGVLPNRSSSRAIPSSRRAPSRSTAWGVEELRRFRPRGCASGLASASRICRRLMGT